LLIAPRLVFAVEPSAIAGIGHSRIVPEVRGLHGEDF
jgi:hypothetical protein